MQNCGQPVPPETHGGTPTSNPRRTAVSYTRFSSPNQAKGDSETRQEHEYRDFCGRHDLAPGKEVFIDRGRSGYHGTRRTMRIRIRAALAAIVESGVVLVMGTKAVRTIAVRFDLVGGARRMWAIHSLPASGARPNPPEPEVKSFAAADADGLDLRNREHAARLEKDLLAAAIGPAPEPRPKGKKRTR